MIDLYIHLIISIKVHAPLNELIIPFIPKKILLHSNFLNNSFDMFYAWTGKPEVAEHSFSKNKIHNNFALHSMKFFFNAIGCCETSMF